MGNNQEKPIKSEQNQNSKPINKTTQQEQIQQIAQHLQQRQISLPQRLTSDYSKQVQKQLFLKNQQTKQKYDMELKSNISIIKNKQTQYPVFKGQINQLERNGFGIQYDENGKVSYEGLFRYDEYDGWGKTTNYQGQFRSSVYDGFGTLNLQNLFYQGYFRNGQFDGQGIIFIGKSLKKPKEMTQDPLNFLLLLLDKNMKNINEFGIEEVYIGNWMKGKRNGLGKLWIHDKMWYSGQFHQGIFHGIGVLSDPSVSSKIIEGCYVNGKRV